MSVNFAKFYIFRTFTECTLLLRLEVMEQRFWAIWIPKGGRNDRFVRVLWVPHMIRTSGLHQILKHFYACFSLLLYIYSQTTVRTRRSHGDSLLHWVPQFPILLASSPLISWIPLPLQTHHLPYMQIIVSFFKTQNKLRRYLKIFHINIITLH